MVLSDFRLKAEDIFDLDQTITKTIFAGKEFPWEVIPDIQKYIIGRASYLPSDFERISEFVWVGKGTSIATDVYIKGPAIIGYDCEIRHCAYLRENVILGNGVVVGNSTEIKNSILFNEVQVPHFNYVGDSILGYKSHLGAGAIISNVKSDKETVKVKGSGEIKQDTGLRKFGALVGNFVEVGCNSVLNPGTIIGQGSIIYPLTMVRGFVPPEHILKNNNVLVKKTSGFTIPATL